MKNVFPTVHAIRVRSLLCGFALVSIGACGGSGSTDPDPPPIQNPVATVSIDNADDLALPQQTIQLHASAKDLSGRILQKTISWSSANASVATVSSSGLVTTVAAGTATISASADGKTANFALTVVAPVVLPADEFAVIPPGSFAMGNANSSHTVTLTAGFRLQKNEVTQSQWRAVTGKSPSFFPGCDQCPVEQVSWTDIQTFIRLLNAASPSAGYRLPTEAEWEYACRAGTTGDYAGTGDLNDMGWYNGNSQVPGGPQGPQDGQTWPVRRKTPNAWGLYDMHGNVWEWVNDWWSAAIDPSTSQNPAGPTNGTTHVIRGGSWLNFPLFATSYFRAAGDESTSERYRNVGFRLARSP